MLTIKRPPDIRSKVAAIRAAVLGPTSPGLSERRACTMIGICRMTVRYRSQQPDDCRLRERLKALADERRRFGYRRLHILLRPEGFVVNHIRLTQESFRALEGKTEL